MEIQKMSDTTRISDLPESNMNGGGGGGSMNGHFMEPIKVSRPRDENVVSAPTYQPMLDIHPNPYGVPKPATLPNFSQESPPTTMPSRDYPRETLGYTQDEQIKVNYIPPSHHPKDFISHHDRANQENWEDHRKKKYRLSKLDHLINEFQTPFFLTILFLIFQLPAFNRLLFKYFSFLSLYHSDGHLNMTGLICKSVLFGLSYYFSLKTIDYFSEV
jgi:hypothetical protein